MKSLFNHYQIEPPFIDEVFKTSTEPQDLYKDILEAFYSYSSEDFTRLNESAKLAFLHEGVTFSVYGEGMDSIDQVFPFDLLPRTISAQEWDEVSVGLLQRNQAINMFLEDIYNDQKILKEKVVPAEMVLSSPHFNKLMQGFSPIGGIYNHISGTDLIKHSDNKFYVLEDNVRCPSGVAYVLSNRNAMRKTFTKIFKDFKVRPVDDYSEQLLQVMLSVSPQAGEGNCVVLTPGAYNSAFYEHAILAHTMGTPLVEGRDLLVKNNIVYMKTIKGHVRVDVIYRRIDDDFIDPMVFDPTSMLGVPGLMQAYREGNVTLINAPGTGASDDKAIYDYIPTIIKYYLDEQPILNNVPTYHCEREEDLNYVLDNLDKVVIKPVDMSGGYGIYIGSKCSAEELEELAKKIKANRRGYVAQPIMNLSQHSTFIDDKSCFEPRHVDLRAFTLLGKDHSYVLQGGLTRVALKKGSLIVNSSQGGGSKDTWIV